MPDEKFNKIVQICKDIPKDKFTVKELFTQAIKGDPLLVASLAKTFIVSKLK
jgi:hypothetical protein